MRIRSIRPEFWTSEDIAALDWDTRLIFIGLWSYVDDNGVGRDVEKLIVADLFPLEDDPRDTLARVHRALAQLSARSLITRYEVDGKPYLHITTWTTHQKIDRPGKERYPLPTSTNATPRDTLATPSREVRDTPSTGEGEKGRRGEVLSSDDSDETDDRFDEFWQHYPRRDGKQDARKAWKQITKKVDPQTIIDGLTAYQFKPDRQFQPMPATWLRGQRWEDEGASIHQLPTATNGQSTRRKQVQIGPDRWRDVSADEVVYGMKTRWV